MAEFLTTNRTSSHIEDIIIYAKKQLFLVSPFLQLSKTFYERIKDASDRGVSIKIIFGKDELKPNERASIEKLENIDLFYFENLHAKCYFNEDDMVITSMNMYEFSMVNNREMGVHINREKDQQLFEKALAETESIMRSSEIIELKKTKRSLSLQKDPQNNKKVASKPQRGYCIRCEARIQYNPERPLCRKCYKEWSKYENPDYIENNCHGCGEYGPSSLAAPICDECFNKFEK
ncbi:MAG: phospholipase D family protein [Candidatus Hodarchaeales archaeon]